MQFFLRVFAPLREKIISYRLITVKKLTLHFPVAEVEPALRTAAQALPIRAPPARKRPAELSVPASKHPTHQTTDFSTQRLHDIYLSKSPKIRFIR